MFSEGDRVYVPAEGGGWPLGVGVVTDVDPDFRKGEGFVAVRLDEAARRHDSDGPLRRDWFIRAGVLRRHLV